MAMYLDCGHSPFQCPDSSFTFKITLLFVKIWQPDMFENKNKPW